MSSNIPDLTGRRIGEYEVVARVGVGGMGAVYEGRQPLIGKRVAVKVLLPTLSGEKELVERFLAEARSVNEIRHRGIVDIFSFGQLPEGAHYFVMEFLEGEAFDRIIKKRAPLGLGEALGWAEEMLDALQAAHEAGIIHRDIKPSNLFLVNTGRGRPYIKLLDFGIAKLGAIQGEATPQTRASVILGTPDYISPEQARGKAISPQTDLYAVGCVLFEMVTGARVFKGENTLQTMWMHVEDTPPVPSTLRPEIPQALDELILWALEKDPTRRPPSAEAMRENLALIRASLLPGLNSPTPAPTGQIPRSSFTPPPSVRQRVLASTPPPGTHGRLGTPPPKSGSQQRALSGKRPPPPPPDSTNLTPLTAIAAPTVAPVTRAEPGRSIEMALDIDVVSVPNSLPNSVPSVAPVGSSGAQFPTIPEVAHVPEKPKSKLPLVLAGAIALLLGSLVVFFSIGGDERKNAVAKLDPKPIDPKLIDPKIAKPNDPKTAKPVEVKPADPKPVDVKPTDAVAVKPADPKPTDVKPTDVKPVDVKPTDVKPVDVKPVDVKPQDPKPKVAKREITSAQLSSRLAKLEQKLAAKEAETGENDRVLRQFLDQARKSVATANSEAERREAWQLLDELSGQFAH